MLPSQPSPAVNAKASAGSFNIPTVAGTGTSKPRTGHQQHALACTPSSKEASSITHGDVSSISSSSEDELLRHLKCLHMHAMQRGLLKGIKSVSSTLEDSINFVRCFPSSCEVLQPLCSQSSSMRVSVTIRSSGTLMTIAGHAVCWHPLPLRSAFANEQILSHCMRVMQSQASQSEEGLCPNATFKGTHQDLEDQCIESREEKDQKICDMLVPVVQNGVIYCSENSAAIFRSWGPGCLAFNGKMSFKMGDSWTFAYETKANPTSMVCLWGYTSEVDAGTRARMPSCVQTNIVLQIFLLHVYTSPQLQAIIGGWLALGIFHGL